MIRFRFSQAFRRNTSQQTVLKLGTTTFKSWYYNPAQIIKWSEGRFNVIRKIPIGLATPPVALESRFLNRKPFVFRLSKWGKRFETSSLLAGMADNFLIDLKLADPNP
jgi:hypothetical protein